MAAAVLVGAGGLTVAGGLPTEAADWPAPIEHPPTVTADRLPTVQVDGVVWDVELVGNTVYAGGQFTTTWPAGASQAQGPRTARSNFLAFDVTTGALRTDINFPANAQVRTLDLAPDGRTLYVGGDFTSFGGQQRRRIAAINTATNTLTNFNPYIDYHVWTIDATEDTVYVGGNFNIVGGQTRTRLAAFTLNGTLLPWAPTADREVQALVVSPDGSKVAIGGRFEVFNGINGRTAQPTSLRWGRGLVVVDGDTSQSTPAILPFAATDIVRNGGQDGGITTLASDGELLYGGGFTYGRSAGTLEGVFAAEWGSGAVRWLNDCHGDTYMVHPQGPVVYAVGHAHYCGNQNGWGQPSTNQNDWIYRRAVAMSKEPAGTTYTERLGYTNFAGQPRPDLLNFYPLITSGSYTGYFQGAWSVTGDSRYLVLGGEFPSVNGTAQRGLVRFAVRSLAPNNQGPLLGGTAWPIKVQSFAAGQATISWQANEDRDDATLEYRVYRRTGGSGNGTLLHTRTETAPWWNRHTMHFTDTSASPGATYQYRVLVTDGFDNFATSPWVSHTVQAGGNSNPHPYTAAVLASSPESWWRLGESAGSSTAVDVMGFRDATVNSGVTLGQPGTIAGDNNTAAQFSGTSSGNVISRLFEHPNHVISLEAWFRAPANANGGLLVGFNNSQTGSGSNTQDRALYMTSDGRVAFGVNPTSGVAVQTAADYRDEQWHHAVGVLSDAGLELYVDGVLRASNENVTNARTGYYGYWRIGAGSTSGLPGGGTGGTSQFEGLIDDVALYKRALTEAEVQAHYAAAGQTNEPPVLDAYAQSVVDASPSLYWRVNETSGTIARDTVGLAHGQYAGTGMTLGTPGALQGVADPGVTFTGGNGRLNRVTQATSPTTFSLELWFNTTSTSVGKLIGYGNGTGSNNSTTYDRHLYLQADGRLVFGTSRSGASNTSQTQTSQQWRITTANAYNDGQWHHVVAAKSPTTGMQLYVDGVLVGNEPTFTSSRNYTGTWRVGGDTTWATGNGSVTGAAFNGRIDEIAVYGSVLTPALVAAHHDLGRGNMPNQPPSANIAVTDVQDLVVTFDGTGSTDDGDDIVSYSWDFGDGSPAGSGATVQHEFPAAGQYTVTLTVTDGEGLAGTAQVTVEVEAPNQAPNAQLEVVSSSFRTIELSGADSNDPDGTIVSYEWDFGDDETATGPEVSHTYEAAGEYVITLTVTDDDGETSTATTSFTATDPPNQAPVAQIEVVEQDELTVELSGLDSSDADGTIVSYEWDFGDGETATGPTATHTYELPDTYTITLTVTDDDGATATAQTTVDVAENPNQAPTAAIALVEQSGLEVSLSGEGSSDADGTIVSYEWDFGDGETATGPTATHEYDAADTYTVTLTVTDNEGATGTATLQVTVAPANDAPIAAIELVEQDGLTVSLSGEGSSDADGTIVSYEWDFGDGETATGPTATHSYGSAGTRTVTLVVTDDDGATGTATLQVTVTAANQAPNAVLQVIEQDGLTVSFSGAGSSDADGTIVSYEWDFGDGETATGPTATHTYGSAGTRTVTLVVTDDDGATGAASTSVTVSGTTPAPPLAIDTFSRNVTNGLGVADQGGPWTLQTSAANYSVQDGQGRLRVQNAGASVLAYLNGVSSTTTDTTVEFELDKAPTGGGTYIALLGRRNAQGDYRVTLRVMANGTVQAYLVRNNAGAETNLTTATTVPGLTFTQGDRIAIRLQVEGTNPTLLRAKVWEVGTAEPSNWLVATNDSNAALQANGGVGIRQYISGSSTGGPWVASFDNLRVLDLSAPAENLAPTAAFTATVDGLSVTLNASDSTDLDGSIVEYRWNFGDGETETTTGPTTAHEYDEDGDYQVTLQVVDDDGAVSATASRQVSVAGGGGEPGDVEPLAADAFERTVNNGWGTAPTGGNWTLSNAASGYAVSGGMGRLTGTVGANRAAYLTNATSGSFDVVADVALDRPATGGGAYVSLVGRRVANGTEFRAKLRFLSTGQVQVFLVRVVNHTETTLSSATVPGINVGAGDAVRVRFQLSGGASTSLATTVWTPGAPEPASPTVTAVDTGAPAALQGQGHLGVLLYTAGSWTGGAPVLLVDNLTATAG